MRDRDAMVSVKFPHVYEDVDRHGNVRVYFMKRGQPKHRFRDPIGSDAFMATYNALLRPAPGPPLPTAAPGSKPRLKPVVAGSWRALCVDYFASIRFTRELDPRTQRTRRAQLEATFDEPIAPGSDYTFADMPIGRMSTKAIKILRDRKASTPEAANMRLKSIRQVFAWAIEDQHLNVKSNPARDVPYFRSSTTGFHSWTIEEVERFEAVHAVGTKARLALALFLYLGARRSDVVLFGRQHVRGKWLRFTCFKGRNRKPVEQELPILPELRRIIDASPCGDLTFLVTENGQPFTSNGFGNRMRKWCDDAGLTACSAHGLRKAGAAIAAENGATDNQLMAIFGWHTIKEAQRYTRAARRKKMAAAGMPLLMRSDKA